MNAKKASAGVDREVFSVIRPKPTKTPSAVQSVSREVELLHRLHGTSLISSANIILEMNPSSFATACCILHRFYHRESLTNFDVWSVAMACVLLAGKVEDDPKTIRQIILCFVHLYRKRRLRCDDDTACDFRIQDDLPKTLLAETLTKDEKYEILRESPPLSPMGQVYNEWKENLIKMESVTLRTLGFVLHWIPDSHPHKFILYFIRALSLDKDNEKILAQRAWNYCNDSCYLDICVRYEPEVTACAAITLSAMELNIKLPSTPRPYWIMFLGSNHEQDLSNICNALLALQNMTFVKDAFLNYIPSLMSKGSFNDPGSFIWLWIDEFEIYRKNSAITS